MTQPIKAVLFDFDGTLYDTNELIVSTFQYVLDHYFPGQYDRQAILPFLGPTLQETFENIDQARSEEMIARYRKWNIENHDRLTKEFPNVSNVLRELKKRGFLLAVVSTKKNDVVMRGINRLEAGNIFDVVIGLDDVEQPKPHPEPLQRAMQALGVTPDETIMVGDNYHDIVGGKNAGVRTVGVAWSLKGESFLQQFQPDYMIQKIEDLLPVLEGETA